MTQTGAKSLSVASRVASFVVLFAIAIPWYWRWLGGVGHRQVFGMPIWFAVAVAASAAISVNAAWQFGRWPDDSTANSESIP